MLRNRFISIGGDCQPAHHIRRLGRPVPPLFFDRIVTPVRSIIPLIESRFEGAFERDALKWKPGPPLDVMDQRYGLDTRHDFRSDKESHVDYVIRRFRAEGRVFLDTLLDPEPLVLVRRWDRCDHGTPHEIDAAEAFSALTLINPRCVILYLRQFGSREAAIQGNVVKCFNPQTAAGWQGDDALYERNFALADRVATELFGVRERSLCRVSVG